VIVTDLSLCGDSACPPRGHCSWICPRHTRVRVKRAPWWRVHARVRVQARAGRREKRCRAAGRAPQPASRVGILAAPRTRKGKEEEGASSTSVRIELPGDACTSIAVSLHSIVWGQFRNRRCGCNRQNLFVGKNCRKGPEQFVGTRGRRQGGV